MPDGLPGAAVDAQGRYVRDPTENVKANLTAAVKRIDDLSKLNAKYSRRLAHLTAYYDKRLAKAETKRVDAVNAVNQLNVQRALDVANTQATTLATQVETARVNTQDLLQTALNPINTAIGEIRTWMLTQQGRTAAVTDTRSENQWRIGTVVSSGLAVAAIIALVILQHK